MPQLTDDFYQDDISPCSVCGQTERGEMYQVTAVNDTAVWYCIDHLPAELILQWLAIDEEVTI